MERNDGQQAESELKGEKRGAIWTRNFILLCIANLSLFLSIQVLLPTLPLYLLEIGGQPRDVGYVMAAYTLAAMLMRAISGWLVDRFNRKRMMMVGLVLLLITNLLYQLAVNVPLILVIRALHGLTFGLVSTAVGTMVADILPRGRLGEGIGYFGMTGTLTMALAPMLGLWLLDEFGASVLFFTAAGLAAITLFNSLPVKSAYVYNGETESSVTGILANMLEKTVWLPALVVFFLSFVYAAVIYFIALYAAGLGISNAGLFFAAFSIAMVLSRPISGRWTDRGGTNGVLLVGHVFLFFSFIVIGFAQTLAGLLSAGVLIGIGFGFCLPTLQALAIRRAPVYRRGAATGTYFMAFDMGLGVGAIIWGYVAEAIGYQRMYYFVLIPLFVSGAIYFRYRNKSVQEQGY